MSNMSYCRFENTLSDLEDCLKALRAMRNGEEERLSHRELQSAKGLASICLQFVEETLEEELVIETQDRGPSEQLFNDSWEMIQEEALSEEEGISDED